MRDSGVADSIATLDRFDSFMRLARATEIRGLAGDGVRMTASRPRIPRSDARCPASRIARTLESLTRAIDAV